MARCTYGLVLLLVAGCAAPERGSQTALLSDGGARGGGGSGGNGGGAGGNGGSGGNGGGGGDMQPSAGDIDMGCGSVCTTTQKGVCAAGHVVCSGGSGACVSDVMPAPVEDCFNDLDDDCDGTVNNGCPEQLVTGTPAGLTAQGNTGATGAFKVRCPANAYVTSIVVYGDSADGYIAGIDISCATPTLTRGTSSYSVTVTPVAPATASEHAADISTGVNDTFDCGTTSFNPGAFVPGAADPGGDDELGMSCESGALTLSAANQLTIAFTKGTPATPSGYTGYPGEAAFEDDCPPGSVLVGFDGLDGDGWFDEIQPVCAPLQVVYKQ